MSATDIPMGVITADQAIKFLRLRSGQSVTQLAHRTDHVPSWLSRIEANERQPSWDGLNDLADALQLSIFERDWLFLSAGQLPSGWEWLMDQPDLMRLIHIALNNQDDPQVNALIREGLRFITNIVEQSTAKE